MTVKEEIREALKEFLWHVGVVEIATIKPDVVAVWVDGRRFGNYDVEKHYFCALMAQGNKADLTARRGKKGSKGNEENDR